MTNLWKYSTLFFVFQLIVGGCVYYWNSKLPISDTNNNAMTIGVVVIFTAVFVLLAAAIHDRLAVCLGTVSVFAVMAFVMTIVDYLFLAFFFIGVALFGLGVATNDTKRQDETRAPFWALMLAGLPLGIGTVAGGVLLLNRKWR